MGISKLRAAERLTKLIAIYCILSSRIFWMTTINRVWQNALPKLALTEMEIGSLDRLVKNLRSPEKNLSHYIIKIARLDSYLARVSDPPPGNLVMWRGFNRLADIAFGFHLAKNMVIERIIYRLHYYCSIFRVRDLSAS